MADAAVASRLIFKETADGIEDRKNTTMSGERRDHTIPVFGQISVLALLGTLYEYKTTFLTLM